LSESERTGWLDLHRKVARWSETTGSAGAVETLVEHGRFTRFLAAEKTTVLGPACEDVAGGCAEIIDPVAFYRQGLLETGGASAIPVDLGGRKALRLVLPLDGHLRALRLEQIVTLDQVSYLPRRIEWRALRLDGLHQSIAVIDIERIERVTRPETPPGAFTLETPLDARIVQRATPAEPLILLGERVLTLEEARRSALPPFWLGPTYRGVDLSEVTETRWDTGAVLAFRYGPFTVWNYGPVVPPELLRGRLTSALVPFAAGTARVFETGDGRRAAERDLGARTVAVAAASGRAELIRALKRLRELR
jgi:hypothetical protein